MEKKRWTEEEALEWVFSQDVTSEDEYYETWRRYRLKWWKMKKGEGGGLGVKAKQRVLSYFGFEPVGEYVKR